MTQPFFAPLLPLLAALLPVAATLADDGGHDFAPTPHDLSRYSEIWKSGWFAAAAKVDPSTVASPAEETPFPYKVVGLADWNGRPWVYLADEQGHIVELTFGLPSQGLSLVQIEENPNGSGAAIVHLREGSRIIPIKLSSGTQFASQPFRPAWKPTPARPYPAWAHNPNQVAPAAVSRGHRIPGTVPVPPSQAVQR